MTRTSMTLLGLGLAATLAGCGWGDRGDVGHAALDAAAADPAPHGWAVPADELVALPPGHPPVTPAPGILPPGHPPVSGSAGCPGAGSASHPDAEPIRDAGDDPGRLIAI